MILYVVLCALKQGNPYLLVAYWRLLLQFYLGSLVKGDLLALLDLAVQLRAVASRRVKGH